MKYYRNKTHKNMMKKLEKCNLAIETIGKQKHYCNKFVKMYRILEKNI